MLKPSIIGVVAMLSLLLSGCGGAQKGDNRIKYESGQHVQVIDAPQTGKYALYTPTGSTPKVVLNLKQGDRIGFERINDEQVRAIGGDYTQVLPNSTRSAFWKLLTE